MQCEPVMTLIICSYISDYILLCITVTVSDYLLLWLFQIMLAAAESQWSSEAQQPISEWTCTSWAEAVPLQWTSEAAPWTSMTTSASSGRDPTGWSSSASTSSPDRWHRTQLIRYSSHSLNLSCQHVLQIMEKSSIQVLALDYGISFSPLPTLPTQQR